MQRACPKRPSNSCLSPRPNHPGPTWSGRRPNGCGYRPTPPTLPSTPDCSIRTAALHSAIPLIRSAVYSAASAVRSAAGPCRTRGSARRRGRRPPGVHRASAAAAPDEDIALELEQSADRAESRGGLSARAALMARAAELTPDSLTSGNPPARRRRSGSGGRQRAAGGDPSPAGPRTAHRPCPARSRQTGGGGLPQLHRAGRRSADLAGGGRGLAAARPSEARDTYTEALQACLVSSQLTRGTTPAEVGAAALAAAPALAPGRDDRRPAGRRVRHPVRGWLSGSGARPPGQRRRLVCRERFRRPG